MNQRPEAAVYAALEITMADTRRLVKYYLDGDPEIHLNLKGFDYAWIVRSVRWRKDMKVLDVGAGFSWLPSYLASRFGCEVWAIDDFGGVAADPFWARHRDPVAYIRQHPEIRFVQARLGAGGELPLPEAYFDCIYSASALEHVPPQLIGSVWQDMDRLLRPGGLQVHAVDIAFPTSHGARHVALAWIFDLLFRFVPRPLRQRFAYETPLAYARTVDSVIHMRDFARFRRGLSALKMVLDPEVAVEPLDYTVNRFRKDGQLEARHYRVGSLLLLLHKVGADPERHEAHTVE